MTDNQFLTLTRDEYRALQENQTPNKGPIKDPKIREVINNLIAGAGFVLGLVMVVDLATPAFDLSTWTEPIFIGYAWAAAYFGIGVTRPNYPKL